MIRLIVALNVALFGSLSWASCEGRLYHQVTKVALKLFHEGKLSREKLLELSQSERPVNPLQDQTPLSSTASAARFFDVMIASGLERDWPRIRAELTSELASYQSNAVAASAANEETRQIITFKEIGRVNDIGLVIQTANLGGRNYIATYDGGGDQIRFYDLWRKEPIFRINVRKLPPEIHFYMDKGSRPSAKVFLLTELQKKTWWGRKNRASLEITKIDLQSGNAEAENLQIDLPDENPPVGIHDIIRGFLRPDSLDRVSKEPDVTGLQTRFAKVYGAHEFTSASGRRLMAVVSVGASRTLEVFEPEKGKLPFMRYEFDRKIHSTFKFVEWENHIYLLNMTFDPLENFATLSIFEPDADDQPITSIRVGNAGFQTEVLPDGELVVVTTGQTHRIYSLFHRP